MTHETHPIGTGERLWALRLVTEMASLGVIEDTRENKARFYHTALSTLRKDEDER